MSDSVNFTNGPLCINLADVELIPVQFKLHAGQSTGVLFEGGIAPVVGQKIETVVYAVDTDLYGAVSYKCRFRVAD